MQPSATFLLDGVRLPDRGSTGIWKPLSNGAVQVLATEELRDHLAAAAKHAARELNRDTANGGLKSYNKPELVELAASMGIQGRSSMTKGELVQAITRASRKR